MNYGDIFPSIINRSHRYRYALFNHRPSTNISARQLIDDDRKTTKKFAYFRRIRGSG
ncbi:hypothetical protein TcasGA2_TC001603 [Tribolium castaneum]|uniref:Uncharacterized protein n=1 Tax=Tribolium castaneum TaxID=7070 RepID=D6W6L3_TRICA|nr:hypothetical protein TcasGA2_TC001603 [Tribolium castaneum]